MENESYKTSDTPLAAYLYYKGMTIVGTVPHDQDANRQLFVFVDTPQRDTWVEEYYTGSGDCTPQRFFQCYRSVRRYLDVGQS